MALFPGGGITCPKRIGLLITGCLCGDTKQENVLVSCKGGRTGTRGDECALDDCG